jgi:ribosomal protein S12 methylthiotransferase accessory factor YcaO
VTRERRHLEIVSINGNPTEAERAAIGEALERLVESEHRARSASVWLRAGRAQGRRLGMYDYRDRFNREDAWRLSARFPPGGREYPGLNGRADAK